MAFYPIPNRGGSMKPRQPLPGTLPAMGDPGRNPFAATILPPPPAPTPATMPAPGGAAGSTGPLRDDAGLERLLNPMAADESPLTRAAVAQMQLAPDPAAPPSGGGGELPGRISFGQLDALGGSPTPSPAAMPAVSLPPRLTDPTRPGLVPREMLRLRIGESDRDRMLGDTRYGLEATAGERLARGNRAMLEAARAQADLQEFNRGRLDAGRQREAAAAADRQASGRVGSIGFQAGGMEQPVFLTNSAGQQGAATIRGGQAETIAPETGMAMARGGLVDAMKAQADLERQQASEQQAARENYYSRDLRGQLTDDFLKTPPGTGLGQFEQDWMRRNRTANRRGMPL